MTNTTQAQMEAARARIVASFPDRPMLEVEVWFDGSHFVVEAGKATRMKRLVRDFTLDRAEGRAVAKLRSED